MGKLYRPTRRVGGVALLIRDQIVAKPINISKILAHLELVGAEIMHGGKPLSIFSIYVPPNEKRIDENFLKYIDTLADYIILGDLNGKLNKFGPQNPIGKSLENWLMTSKGTVLNKMNDPTFFKYKLEKSGDST